MSYLVYRSAENPAKFVVTDPDHARTLGPESGLGALDKIGEFEELGEARVAFDERLARSAIARQGYYTFEATGYQPVPSAPEAPV